MLPPEAWRILLGRGRLFRGHLLVFGGAKHVGEGAWFEAWDGRKLSREGAMRLCEEAVSALEEELWCISVGLTAREMDVLHLVADTEQALRLPTDLC